MMTSHTACVCMERKGEGEGEGKGEGEGEGEGEEGGRGELSHIFFPYSMSAIKYISLQVNCGYARVSIYANSSQTQRGCLACKGIERREHWLSNLSLVLAHSMVYQTTTSTETTALATVPLIKPVIKF